MRKKIDKKKQRKIGRKDKSTKGLQALQDEKEMTIIELAMQEKNLPISEQKSQQGKGESRIRTKEVFRMWMSLPDQFKGAPERIVELLGITDPITIELLGIATSKQFADKFGLHPPTLSRWRYDVERDSDFALDVKKGLRKLTRNVLGALYRKALDEGDAPRAKLWLQYIEDWREQLGVDHSGHVSNLTDGEKEALDKLIKKNKGV